MKRKALTKSQLKEFEHLYLKGYSAWLIFKNLGQPYPKHNYADPTSRMVYYRNKLGLPKRGTGFQGIHRPSINPLKQQQCREERMQQLETMIKNWKPRIENWEKELHNLKTLVYEARSS